MRQNVITTRHRSGFRFHLRQCLLMMASCGGCNCGYQKLKKTGPSGDRQCTEHCRSKRTSLSGDIKMKPRNKCGKCGDRCGSKNASYTILPHREIKVVPYPVQPATSSDGDTAFGSTKVKADKKDDTCRPDPALQQDLDPVSMPKYTPFVDIDQDITSQPVISIPVPQLKKATEQPRSQPSENVPSLTVAPEEGGAEEGSSRSPSPDSVERLVQESMHDAINTIGSTLEASSTTPCPPLAREMSPNNSEEESLEEFAEEAVVASLMKAQMESIAGETLY